jgi:hypothetical protein
MRWFLSAPGKRPLFVEDLYTALITALAARAIGVLDVRICCEVSG